MAEKDRDKRTECYTCKHKENFPGDCHIVCKNPDSKMRGDPHGIRNGWFCYPMLFDPTWKLNLCNNYEKKQTNNSAVSHPVS